MDGDENIVVVRLSRLTGCVSIAEHKVSKQQMVDFTWKDIMSFRWHAVAQMRSGI
jgi:hypothetical protein